MGRRSGILGKKLLIGPCLGHRVVLLSLDDARLYLGAVGLPELVLIEQQLPCCISAGAALPARRRDGVVSVSVFP